VWILDEEWHDDGSCVKCFKKHTKKDTLKRELCGLNQDKVIDIHSIMNIFDNIDMMAIVLLLLKIDTNMETEIIIDKLL
jgi:hypothetical protein